MAEREQARRQIIEALRDARRIIVTGPQRSGTRIGAKYISLKSGLEYVDENEIGVSSIKRLVARCCGKTNFVIQAPSLSYMAHNADLLMLDAVVFMTRPVREIIASERRIGWNLHREELAKYERDGLLTLASASNKDHIAKIKMMVWLRVQAPILEQKGICMLNFFYPDLEGCELWIPAELRSGFSPFQTSLDDKQG